MEESLDICHMTGEQPDEAAPAPANSSIDCYFASILGVQYAKSNEMSPLALAYIGDSVFDLIVKTVAVTRNNKQPEKYHKEVSRFVKAQAQAAYIDMMLDGGVLTEDEQRIYKRGRNAKAHHTAKNASVIDYRKATGFECLVGYLYLDKQYDRMFELARMCMEQMQ